MRKILAASAALVLLAGCNATQQAKFQTFAAKANTVIQTGVQYVQIGCQLDGKYVPLGQDAGDIIAANLGLVNPAYGAFVTTAVAFDKLALHPSVQAVCASLVGAGATVAGQTVQPPTVTLVAPPVAPSVAIKPSV